MISLKPTPKSIGKRIAGYAAIFDHPDRGGDVIRKGAFRRLPTDRVPLLLQHIPTRRIGWVEQLEEDDRGLRVIARMEDDTPVRAGTGLSFGYRVRHAENRTYRELNELDLIEVSVVTHPMQPHARVLAVQQEGRHDEL
jgi:uncharacterized protein